MPHTPFSRKTARPKPDTKRSTAPPKRDGWPPTGSTAWCDTPQYTGIFLAIVGQFIHWPTIPTLALFPVIVWANYRLAKKEEQQMLAQFGTQYALYQQ